MEHTGLVKVKELKENSMERGFSPVIIIIIMQEDAVHTGDDYIYIRPSADPQSCWTKW